jgi:hypothetical protein
LNSAESVKPAVTVTLSTPARKAFAFRVVVEVTVRGAVYVFEDAVGSVPSVV